MCVLAELALTTTTSGWPHEKATAADVKCEDRRAISAETDRWDAQRGRKIRSGMRQPVPEEDVVKILVLVVSGSAVNITWILDT